MTSHRRTQRPHLLQWCARGGLNAGTAHFLQNRGSPVLFLTSRAPVPASSETESSGLYPSGTLRSSGVSWPLFLPYLFMRLRCYAPSRIGSNGQDIAGKAHARSEREEHRVHESLWRRRRDERATERSADNRNIPSTFAVMKLKAACMTCNTT